MIFVEFILAKSLMLEAEFDFYAFAGRELIVIGSDFDFVAPKVIEAITLILRNAFLLFVHRLDVTEFLFRLNLDGFAILWALKG
jgi:hypothetical protein